MDLRLRPVREPDLEMFRRFMTEPGLIGNDWFGFRDPGQVARRFAEDGYLGTDNGRLTVEVAGAGSGTGAGEGTGAVVPAATERLRAVPDREAEVRELRPASPRVVPHERAYEGAPRAYESGPQVQPYGGGPRAQPPASGPRPYERSDGTATGMVTWGAGRYGGAAGFWEIGIALLPEHRGRGIGWRAQALLADYLFQHTPAQRIQAGTQPENVAEQKALLKAGFQLEGVIRAAEFRAGQWRDGLLYSRLRDDPAPKLQL